jgi:5'-nucleotidase
MGRVRFRGPRGFQYSGAAFVANPATAGALITTRSHAALRILVSNDDGYRAEGLHQLAEALRPLASVTVVAPDRNRSGASNSLTLDVPLRVFEFGERQFYVQNGTPTDCVHLAISGLFPDEVDHDMVVSGINDGANLGDDVLYSGTVAAAIEGRFLGLSAIAISLVMREGRYFATAARVASELIMRLQRSPLHSSMILNVNVPDVPYEHLRGFKPTRLGYRHRSEPVMRTSDPRGRSVYWVGPAGEGADAGEGTDFDAVANGYVSVTPLQVDLTRYAALEEIGDWLSGRPE